MMGDDHPSLEYIEDSYLPSLPPAATPSLDELTEFDHDRDLFDDDYDDFTYVDGTTTAEWSAETELYLRSMPLDQLFCIAEDQHDLQKVEAELCGDVDNNNVATTRAERTKLFIKRLFTRKSMRDVRVTFIDLSKPYLAKISSSDNYKSFLNIGSHGMFVFVMRNYIKLDYKLARLRVRLCVRYICVRYNNY